MTTVETDYYFVWSELMKEQLLQYYPKTREEQIFVTGTPQFEPHYDKDLLLSRKQFCLEHKLSEETRYICFSGDDQTTSPLDQYYLEDTAIAVRKLREEGEDVAIVYRKVPIDFSGRYDEVLANY
jgi:UDP-N-acetylglucosamine 2-epimerase